MMEGRYSPEHEETNPGCRKARYAYYRRAKCSARVESSAKRQGEGRTICHAHAGQLATALRRERERQAVRGGSVAQMRRRGRPECEMADLSWISRAST